VISAANVDMILKLMANLTVAFGLRIHVGCLFLPLMPSSGLVQVSHAYSPAKMRQNARKVTAQKELRRNCVLRGINSALLTEKQQGRWFESEIGMPHRAWERQHVADIGNACHVHHKALKTQAKAGVLHRAEAPQIKVPAVVLFLQAQLPDAGQQDVMPLLTLAAAQHFPHTRHQQVNGGDRLAVIILPHVESFDFLGVIRHKHRQFKMLFAQVALMFRLQVHAPENRIVKRLA
jgi:hypothetical protein